MVHGMVLESVDGAIRRRTLLTRMGVVFAVSLLLSACQAKPSFLKPRLEEEGQFFVYLQPLPEEADRLVFRLDGMSAVREDGSPIPVSLHINEIGGKGFRRERLLASGILPPGQYSGFSFRAAGATLKGEEGDIALSIAEDIPKMSHPFLISKRKALVLSLKFRYRDSVSNGFRFAPSFSAEVPGKLAAGLIGLVSSRGTNTVTIFDKVSGRVAAVVPTGSSPSGMAMDPASRRAYVALSGEDAVETIDILGNAVIGRGPLAVGDNPEELALLPDGRTLLVANAGSNTVSFVDAASLVETKRVQVGAGPQSVLVDRVGRRAYVFNAFSNTISVLDVVAKAVVATVATESGPVRGQFNRGGNRLYVLHRQSPYLVVLDPVTLSVVRRVHVGSGGAALKVDPRTDLIYLARQRTGEIAVYDPFSFLPIDFYRTGGDAAYLTIDGEGNNLCAVLPGESGLRMVRLVGKVTVSETEVGEGPFRVTLMGER